MTIARILFPLPLPEPFDYIVPDHLSVETGSYVIAPLGTQKRIGVVVDCQDLQPDRKLKALLEVLPTPPMGRSMRQFIDFCARYTVSPPGLVLSMALRSSQGLLPSPMRTVYHTSDRLPDRMTAARRAVLETVAQHPGLGASALAKLATVSAGVIKSLAESGVLAATNEPVDRPFPAPDPNRPGIVLTPEQATAADQLRHHIAAEDFKPVLLDGVTGSGKTEVYFEAIAAIIKQDETAQILVLLPEIALTEAVLNRFEKRFGARPAAWHSGLSQPQRRRTWREVAHGRARIVAGARSALFLPYANLRLIIVDEEHDGSFKQEDGVTYHARDMAVMRAKLEQAMIILASATPALETVVNADTGRYHRIALAARPGLAQLPDVELVDLKTETPAKGEWLSPVLKSALLETFSRGEQSLLFMNRRGYAPLVIC
ncbi:MAG: Primosomal protein N' [Hyphomonas sp. TMED17]|nr:MAG: Primosomal protein N' [Hyphomonas sp. TMED17]